jgi:hypothetical protein
MGVLIHNKSNENEDDATPEVDSFDVENSKSACRWTVLIIIPSFTVLRVSFSPVTPVRRSSNYLIFKRSNHSRVCVHCEE